MSTPRYWPFFCEENIWHLVDGLDADDLTRASVLLVTNSARQVAIWHQRASDDPRGAVVWDYHVVLAIAEATGAMIWDLDSTLGTPAPFDRWVEASFRRIEGRAPDRYDPRFRVVPADVFRARFTTDRSHMRTAGTWIKEPPPWDPPGQTPTADGALPLSAWLDLDSNAPGRVVTLDALAEAIL